MQTEVADYVNGIEHFIKQIRIIPL